MKWMLALALLMLGACGTATESPPPAGETNETSDPPPLQAPDIRVLVRPDAGEDIHEIVADVGGTVLKRIENTNVYVVELPPDTDLDAFIATLEGDVRVLDSEHDRRVSSPEGGGATLPIGGDFFAWQIAGQAELVRIGADAARSKASGVGVRIAVIDSGVDATHDTLVGRVEPGGWDFIDNDDDPADEANGLDDDGDGLIDEGWGHGTFVSSLVLAMAQDVTILPYRVLDSDSNGLASHVAEAIMRAADAGVHAINLSLGMENPVFVVREAIQYAKQMGVPVIASAGNTGQEDVTFPASITEAFAVTSVDVADLLAVFSSYGDDVDLSAPGTRLIGAYPTAPDAAVMWPGTSFSAAVVTGLWSLMRELYPATPPQVLLDMIGQSSLDVDPINPAYAGKMGAGRIDADAATSSGP